ncbi:Translocon at the inner envelope membrane of chloroplasts 32 [Hyphodiscus hymeniophilus]|uniref:Translocon at the inner envelope membrane of chloroplasts 32 n=1 Tax=Hyphodiscus hymeniophilus TaxID=353542 RepID=A0A9P7AZ25_9HELO|nr:Translocon at the inner envelope membrane of chloroplasts 32 [Hyphodiscus hymeniophilus]
MPQFQWSSTGDEVVNAFPSSVHDKIILITGPSPGGVGAETALSLARGNPKHLLLAGRSHEKIKPVIDEINKINAAIKVTFIQLNLDSQASVRRAAKDIQVATDKIDILINNAAIMACPYAKTEDGIESQFGTNHIGPFLLTNLLLPTIEATGKGARIVNLTSTGAALGEINFDDINFNDGKTYVPIAGYAQSKVASILFTVSLSKKFDNKEIASFSVHPGNISTGLQEHFKDPDVFKTMIDYVVFKAGGPLQREELKTLQQGCATTLVAALDPSILDSSGKYLRDGGIAEEQPKVEATDPVIAERLWALSEKLVGQHFD